MNELYTRLRQNYFADRNYSILYLHSIVKGIGFTVMFLYIGGWLYKTGLGLEWVFAYHAAHFGLMNIFSPLSALSAKRYGMPVTYAISFLMLFIGLLSLAFAQTHIAFIIIGVFFSGLGFGLQGPIDAVLYAFYVSNENRGKVFSIINVISVILSSAIVILIGVLMDSFGLLGVCILCGISWGVCSALMFLLEKPTKAITSAPTLSLYKDYFSKPYRPYFTLAFGYHFVIIAAVVVVPLILYLATNNFTGMSFIAAVAMIAQTIILSFYGRWVDKSHMNQHPLLLSTTIHAIGLGMFTVLNKVTSGLFLAQIIQRTGFMMYMGVVFPRLHQSIVDRKLPLVDMGVIHHMQITFWEIITLMVMFAIVSVYGVTSLPAITIICMTGSYATYFGLKAIHTK